MGMSGFPVHSVYRALDNPYFDRFVRNRRKAYGMPPISRRSGLFQMMRVLKSGGYLGLVVDQDTKEDPVFVDFFGRSASTAPGPAVLARRTGAALVPMFITRNTDTTQTIHIHEPIICERSSNENEDIQTATAAFTLAIEQQIRKDPAQWSWSNWRWRTQPYGKDNTAKIPKKTLLKRFRLFVDRFRK